MDPGAAAAACSAVLLRTVCRSAIHRCTPGSRCPESSIAASPQRSMMGQELNSRSTLPYGNIQHSLVAANSTYTQLLPIQLVSQMLQHHPSAGSLLLRYHLACVHVCAGAAQGHLISLQLLQEFPALLGRLTGAACRWHQPPRNCLKTSSAHHSSAVAHTIPRPRKNF